MPISSVNHKRGQSIAAGAGAGVIRTSNQVNEF